MSNIQIDVHGESKNRDEMVDAVDKEIDEFDKWFVQSFEGAEPLLKFERAILKTFLLYKIQAQDPPAEPGSKQTEATH